MLKDRQAYETRLDEQLNAWDADLQSFKEKAKSASVDGMMKYDQAVQALKHKHEEAGRYLAELKATSDDTWEQVKAGTEKAWSELKALFQHLGNPE